MAVLVCISVVEFELDVCMLTLEQADELGARSYEELTSMSYGRLPC